MALRQQVNFQILARLEKIYLLAGFTGDRTPGVRKGTISSGFDTVPVQPGLTAAADELAIEEDNENIDDADEDGAGDIGGLVDYIAELPLKE